MSLYFAKRNKDGSIKLDAEHVPSGDEVTPEVAAAIARSMAVALGFSDDLVQEVISGKRDSIYVGPDESGSTG